MFNRIREWCSNLWWEHGWRVQRPLLSIPCTCRLCEGRGGHQSYYGEWDECRACYEFEERWEGWFKKSYGRVPFFVWLNQLGLERLTGSPGGHLGYGGSTIRLLMCRSRVHRWDQPYLYSGYDNVDCECLDCHSVLLKDGQVSADPCKDHKLIPGGGGEWGC